MSILRGRCSDGTNRQQLKNFGELKSCGEKAFLVFLQNQNRTVAILSEHTAKCLCKCVTSAAPYSFCKGSVGSLGLGLALDKYSKKFIFCELLYTARENCAFSWRILLSLTDVKMIEIINTTFCSIVVKNNFRFFSSPSTFLSWCIDDSTITALPGFGT